MEKIKNNFHTIVGWVKEHKKLYSLYVFSFFFLVFLYTYFSVDTTVSGDDHFFHFRFAEQMRQNGFLESFKDFKAIYFSKMAQGGQYYIFYNFLFYLFIIPFTYLDPLVLGIKLYAVFSVAISFTILYWASIQLKIKNSFLWTLIFFGITQSLMWRFFLSRPYTLTPVFLILLLIFLHKRNYLGVFLINLFYLFWHDATFFFPLGVSVVYFIFEKFYGHRGNLKNLFFSFLGTIISVVIVCLISPGFFLFIKEGVLDIFINLFRTKVPIPFGGETYPVDFLNFIYSTGIFMCLVIVSIFVFVYKYINIRFSFKNNEKKIQDEIQNNDNSLLGATFFLTISFLLGTVTVSMRFQDFFVFFSGLFIIITFDEIIYYFNIEKEIIRKALISGLVFTFAYLFLANVLSIQNSIALSGTSEESFKSAGEWLNQNVEKKEVIFNVSWSWFSELYYQSPSHNYVIGILPSLLYSYNKDLYWKWSHISSDGYVCSIQDCPEIKNEMQTALRKKSSENKWYETEGGDIANSIIKDFQSHYIISSSQFKALNNILDNNRRFVKVFDSQTGVFIYRVNLSF